MHSTPRRAQVSPVFTVPIPLFGCWITTSGFRRSMFGLHTYHLLNTESPQPYCAMIHCERAEDGLLHQFGNAHCAQLRADVGCQIDRHARVLIFRSGCEAQWGADGVVNKFLKPRVFLSQGIVVCELVW